MAIGLALLAGMLTVLNPCVLPMLPLLFAGALAEGRSGPLMLGLGLVLAFTGVGLLVATVGPALGLGPEAVRLAAALGLLGAGTLLVSTPAQLWLARRLAPLAQRSTAVANRMSLRGPAGQLALGALMGAVWSPCVGPTLGAALAVAMPGGGLGRTAVILLAFGTGMAGVLLALAYLFRTALRTRMASLSAVGAGARRVFGWSLVAVATLIVTGLDRVLETTLTGAMPDWLLSLTTRF
ncbi:MAG: cytochrome c biogenesis CcdA family protein [Gemmatimonadales bacterium]